MRIDKIMFKNENRQLNFIDLFAGAGGLSEGFFQAGFNPIAHVEMNKSASKTLETRSAYYYLKKNNELDLYYQYERGQITRDELFSHIPDDVIKTVINAEMSPDTLPGIFEQIDTILKEDKVSDVDVIIGGPPCQENIQKLLTIEQNTNPVEIVLHVYKLKEGWDVNNLFTIIPLNAAKSDILALQTRWMTERSSMNR